MTANDQTPANARREEVRTRYAEAARRVGGSQAGEQAAGCCGAADASAVLATIEANADCCGGGSGGSSLALHADRRATREAHADWRAERDAHADWRAGQRSAEGAFGAAQYGDSERRELPDGAVAASLGCGNPLAVADLNEGETVLDLGSGGGIDVLLSARRVGTTGRAYGLDMTDEMLDLARRNAAEAGLTNVEFRKGQIEAIPLPDASVDVVISNCVINLSTDKPAVLAEAFRVLRPGGRLGVSDVVAEDHLSPADRAERGQWVGCIAGALTFAEYRDGLTAAGFTDVRITPTHQAADGMHSAIVKAVKPPTPPR